MKSVYEQIRRLRRQMDEDFEIHSERLNAKTLAIAQLQTTVTELATSVDKLRGCSELLLHTSQASEESFRTYRRRYEKVLDVLQTGQLTPRRARKPVRAATGRGRLKSKAGKTKNLRR